MAVSNPKNIYWMLSYAYRVLEEGAFKDLSGEEFDNIHNLFAEIIYLGVSHLIKRGLTREYSEVTEQINTVRGRIIIKDSLLALSNQGTGLVCGFDEYSLDTQMNRTIKTTMNLLIQSGDVKEDRRIKLKHLMRYFTDVELINPFTVNWSSFKYHRNNATYKMLMNLCYLIISGMIISESGDKTYRLSEFIDDQEKHALYERFILEYFKRHHPEFNPRKERISWNTDSDSAMIDLLPSMETDVSLRYENRVLIIDAKHYSTILTASNRSNFKKLRSAHLYQIFAYVRNMDRTKTGNVEGMLLYAHTGEDIPEYASCITDGNKIHVSTLDLSGDWEGITKRLEDIAAYLKYGEPLR